MQQWTGDYAAAVASHERALAMFRSFGSRFDEADALCELGFVTCMMGDHDTADACHREALELFRSLGDRLGQGWALEGLGLVQMATGDYPAAAASFQSVLRLHRELGARHSQALTLNSLGELSRLTSAVQQAREYHGQALAIAIPAAKAEAIQSAGSLIDVELNELRSRCETFVGTDLTNRLERSRIRQQSARPDRARVSAARRKRR